MPVKYLGKFHGNGYAMKELNNDEFQDIVRQLSKTRFERLTTGLEAYDKYVLLAPQRGISAARNRYVLSPSDWTDDGDDCCGSGGVKEEDGLLNEMNGPGRSMNVRLCVGAYLQNPHSTIPSCTYSESRGGWCTTAAAAEEKQQRNLIS